MVVQLSSGMRHQFLPNLSSCCLAVKALARLHICSSSFEYSLFTYAISTKSHELAYLLTIKGIEVILGTDFMPEDPF